MFVPCAMNLVLYWYISDNRWPGDQQEAVLFIREVLYIKRRLGGGCLAQNLKRRLYEIQGTGSSPLSLGTEAGLSFIAMD